MAEAKKAAPKKSSGMMAGAEIPQQIESFNPDDEKEEATFSIFGLLIKLLMALMFSTIIASLISSLVGVWLRESSFRANTQSNILFGLFIGTFAHGHFCFLRYEGYGMADSRRK